MTAVYLKMGNWNVWQYKDMIIYIICKYRFVAGEQNPWKTLGISS